ncbi:MAG: hypothetical protein QNJ81_09275 [Acidimicrobiia bacterium]|nr:hypothetical protein [Acidimicrobiia bacterium]
MSRSHVLFVVVALALAGCGGSTDATTTSPPAVATTTPTTAGGQTTTAAPATTSTTTAPPSTTTTTTTTSTAAPAPGDTLADGRPATLVAITDDYLAVAVDTVTGEIVHEYGQTGTAAQVESAEEMPPNVLVSIWRVRDGAMVGISDCCEPAAGNIFYLPADGSLGPDPYANERVMGWTLSPSPTADTFAILGYSMLVDDPAVPDFGDPGLWVDDPSLGFPMGAAAWTRDGSELYWSTRIGEVTALATLDLAEGAPTHVTLMPWVGVHQSLDGIGSQANGNLVGFLHTFDGGSGVTETSGVVFSTTGEVLATFPVELGSTWGGYDPSGVFLLYVDGEGTVRWQGNGQSGEIADGFIFASW